MQRKTVKLLLENRYPKSFVDKILNYFELSPSFSVCELIDKFNRLLDASAADKLEFCFYLYDENVDGVICMKDLMDLL